MGAKGARRITRSERRLAGAMAALLLLALTPACAKKEPGERTLVFWQFSPLSAIEPIVARFEAEHPGLDVAVEQLTWQSGREKIVAAIAAGRPPDLCELGSTFLPGLVADSTLLDLTDRVSDLRDSLVGWDIVRHRGRAYALPWLLGTRALYVNRDLLARAGLDPDAPVDTWQDLMRASRAISGRIPGVNGFGMNAGEREILIKKFMPFAWGNGGSILDSTLTRSVLPSSANVEALRFYLSLKPYSLLDRQEMHEQAFAKGRLGVVISGPWLLRTLPKTAPTLRYSVSLMPRPAKNRGTHASFAGAEVLGVFRNAAHVDDALELARFLIRSENAMPLFIETGNAFPAAASAAADSYFATHPSERVFLEQLRTAVSPPLHPRWVEIEEIVNGELEEAIYGRKGPEAALTSAHDRVEALLARSR